MILRIVRPHRIALLAAVLVLACTSSGAGPDEGAPADGAKVVLPGGLTQQVTVLPASPASGTNVEVRSVIANEGAAPVTLTSRICGLDYAGALALTHPPEVMKCAGVSTSGSLAPGDSAVVHDIMRVTSAPGTHELRVRHALDPERWVSVEVVVRAP